MNSKLCRTLRLVLKAALGSSNCTHLGGNVYFVTSQAGFRKALKHCFEGNDWKGCVKSWPVEYPDVIEVVDMISACARVYAVSLLNGKVG